MWSAELFIKEYFISIKLPDYVSVFQLKLRMWRNGQLKDCTLQEGAQGNRRVQHSWYDRIEHVWVKAQVVTMGNEMAGKIVNKLLLKKGLRYCSISRPQTNIPQWGATDWQTNPFFLLVDEVSAKLLTNLTKIHFWYLILLTLGHNNFNYH